MHGVGAVPPDEVIGIKPVGQKGEGQARARLQVWQSRINGPESRPLAGAIAVEAQDRLRDQPPEKLELVLSQGGPQRRYRMLQPGLPQGGDVHIAFDHDNLAALVGRSPGG